MSELTYNDSTFTDLETSVIWQDGKYRAVASYTLIQEDELYKAFRDPMRVMMTIKYEERVGKDALGNERWDEVEVRDCISGIFQYFETECRDIAESSWERAVSLREALHEAVERRKALKEQHTEKTAA